ncbi:hypothetical protein KW805_04565 [Candidatus Pacearchaeota archaeon]|nr:hypothetical protein [Candidatus Pacearchaeota archaeon]
MKLKASARGKKRYILLSIADKEKAEKIFLESLGTLGWAKAHPLFMNLGNKVVIVVDSACVDDIRAACELSSEDISIIRVSGTLKGLKR